MTQGNECLLKSPQQCTRTASIKLHQLMYLRSIIKIPMFQIKENEDENHGRDKKSTCQFEKAKYSRKTTNNKHIISSQPTQVLIQEENKNTKKNTKKKKKITTTKQNSSKFLNFFYVANDTLGDGDPTLILPPSPPPPTLFFSTNVPSVSTTSAGSFT